MLLVRNVYTAELPETHKAEWDARLRCYGDTKSLTIGRVSGDKTFIFSDVKSQKNQCLTVPDYVSPSQLHKSYSQTFLSWDRFQKLLSHFDHNDQKQFSLEK